MEETKAGTIQAEKTQMEAEKAETAQAENAGAGKADPEGKAFTQADVERMISARVNREREKWEQTVQAKVSEAQKLAGMTAEQRTQAEREQAEKRLAEKERELTSRELRLTAIDTLNQKGLPVELADCLAYTDAEVCGKSLESVSKAFEKAVSKKVDERLRQAPPKAGSEKQASYDAALRAAAGLSAK